MAEPDAFPGWFAALEARHLERLAFAEVRRALQSLSSLYVERRGRLSASAAFSGAGKRAAFALYYGALHFLTLRAVLRGLGRSACAPAPKRIVDLGCGTGVAGACWAVEAGRAPSVLGVERHPWAAAEARWTLRALGVAGRVERGDLGRGAARLRRGVACVVAWTANELSDAARERLLAELLAAAARGARLLVVEPISKRAAPWWPGWAASFAAAGGREDEWRVPAELPPRLALLDRAAGLDHRQLTARTLWLSPR